MELDLGFELFIWAAVALATVYVRWKRRIPGVGLVSAYLLFLAWIHWIPAVLYLLPWYWPLYSERVMRLGFEQSLLGVIAFAVGAVVVGPWLGRRQASVTSAPATPQPVVDFSRLPLLYLAIGLFSRFVLLNLLGGVPTVSTFLGSLGDLLYAGLALLVWQAWQARRWLPFAGIMGISLLWPIVTVSGQGFLGAGLTLPILIFLFVARLLRRPYVMLALGLIAAYLGISVSVTYSINREDIRRVTWDTTSSVDERLGATFLVIENFQWLDLTDNQQLARIEGHTNQNFLAGSAVDRLQGGYIDYARGETITDALLMLAPRALWPDKPVSLGGNVYVSRYSGITFSSGTAVGMGQVMEFYVNFGEVGVLLGFVIMGIVVALFDQMAALNLWRGHWPGFALWYVPAIGLLQTGNNLLAVVAGTASSWIAIYFFNRWWINRRFKRAEPSRPETHTI